MTVPEYVLTRRRMKNIRIRVKAPSGEVHVSAPHHVPRQQIDAFVAREAAWIASAQERALAADPPLTTGPEADAARRRLRELVPAQLAYWSGVLGVDEPTFTIRRMSTRWGSCNASRRHINLSLELGRKDQELLEYVVVHELAHLSVPHHGPEFAAIMDAALPGWRDARRRLNGR